MVAYMRETRSLIWTTKLNFVEICAKWNSVEISKPAAPLFGASLRSGLFRPGPRRIPTGSGFGLISFPHTNLKDAPKRLKVL